MKGNDYYNIHRKFQVHSPVIWIRSKNKNREVATTHPSTCNFDSLPYPTPRVVNFFFFFAKMTAKDDPIITCSHLVAETRLDLTF